MRTEIKLTDAIGKVFEGFAFSGTRVVLTFSDGGFVTLDIDHGYESGDETIEEGSLNLCLFNDEKLIGLGVITREELAERRTQDDKAFSVKRAQRERAEYERLKSKFEG